MKVKVFQPNSHGKIEFTRAELEKLLNEIYDGGFRDGEAAQREKSTWTWTSPYRYSDSITLTNSTNSTNAIDNQTNAIDQLTCTYDNITGSKTETVETVEACNVDRKPFTVTMKLNESDVNKAAEALRNMLDQKDTLTHQKVNDVFSSLAKELNF